MPTMPFVRTKIQTLRKKIQTPHEWSVSVLPLLHLCRPDSMAKCSAIKSLGVRVTGIAMGGRRACRG